MEKIRIAGLTVLCLLGIAALIAVRHYTTRQHIPTIIINDALLSKLHAPDDFNDNPEVVSGEPNEMLTLDVRSSAESKGRIDIYEQFSPKGGQLRFKTYSTSVIPLDNGHYTMVFKQPGETVEFKGEGEYVVLLFRDLKQNNVTPCAKIIVRVGDIDRQKRSFPSQSV